MCLVALTVAMNPPTRGVGRRATLSWIPPLLAAALTTATAVSADEQKPTFRRPPLTQFIAALGDPQASSGTGAQTWGLWVDDPGPRGVRLSAFDSKLVQTGGKHAGWQFDKNDWWLEEHGLIMPAPDALPARMFDRESGSTLPARRYVVS